MRGKVIIGILICIVQQANTLDWYTPSLYVSSFTNLVNRRYFLIERLKHTISLLEQVSEKMARLDFLIPRISISSFSHERIKLSIQEIIKTKSLKPLFIVWEDFHAYTALEDELFVEEFTKEVFLITKSVFMFTNIYAINELEKSILDINDKVIDRELIGPTSSNNVIMRFYTFERLRNALELLKKLQIEDPALFFKEFDQLHCKFDERCDECSSYLQRLYTQLEHDRNITTLIDSAKELKHFKYLDNEKWTREIVCMIFKAYKNYIINKVNKKPERQVTITDIIDMYNRLEALPVDELLNGIDFMVAFSTDLYSQAQSREPSTFNERLQKYWWVVPVIGVSVLLKIIKHYSKLKVQKI